MSNIEWFEKPIIKKASEMNAGDIYHCSFGHPDNVGKFVFEKCEPSEYKGTKIFAHNIGGERHFEMFDLDPIEKATFEVVGKVL